jgi:hypothetical protein
MRQYIGAVIAERNILSQTSTYATIHIFPTPLILRYYLPLSRESRFVAVQKFMGSTCPEHTIQQRASAGIKEVGKDNSNTTQQKQQQPGGESKLMKNLRNQHIQATKQTSDLVPKYKIGGN